MGCWRRLTWDSGRLVRLSHDLDVLGLEFLVFWGVWVEALEDLEVLSGLSDLVEEDVEAGSWFIKIQFVALSEGSPRYVLLIFAFFGAIFALFWVFLQFSSILVDFFGALPVESCESLLVA